MTPSIQLAVRRFENYVGYRVLVLDAHQLRQSETATLENEGSGSPEFRERNEEVSA